MNGDLPGLLAKRRPAYVDRGVAAVAWFALHEFMREGMDRSELERCANAIGGAIRRWPEEIPSGRASWRPSLPPGDYLTVPLDALRALDNAGYGNPG
ncbi:MAG TPA: hypothetical protein VJT75_17875 [Thermoleophilaceae bacterium]|nr:hypothetical protein [Thermoleophilaceae bacterium]